ncbi:AMP-binding protein [Nocardia vinacea]|uniref:AMP-binding protein n=1 Tax=Nocardia vinacea TaxID=96468 RepID=A0ABZ1YY27_9NOCA|nr:AMP-binding protein [Nocardia vinacea]
MSLIEYLDKGASIDSERPCLVTDGEVLTYADVQDLSFRVARALTASGVRTGDKVAILSSNDPLAFASVFGISRAGAVWCPINPRNEAAENQQLLDLFDCTCLIFQSTYAPMVEKIAADLPTLTTYICLDSTTTLGVDFASWLAAAPSDTNLGATTTPECTVMLVGTGGTTGAPKGVELSAANIDTMTALTLMSYPFEDAPVYLAMAPLTHAAGVLCFPIMTHGGRIVIMRQPDVPQFLSLVESHCVTHTFLPPTLIYVALTDPAAPTTDYSSLQCFWYGAAPISPTRLSEAIDTFGPVMAQLFGQSEAPMMISTMAPRDHFDASGAKSLSRFASAGHPTPLTTVAIMAKDGTLLPLGETGEIVVRGPLVMTGYYKNPDATAEASQFGWHHTGDIGYLDEDNFLFIVDRAKDMIITGGFNVYSVEVEQALMKHPAILEAAVVGLPDDKWGERVVAVVQPADGADVNVAEVTAHMKELIGSVKTPKNIHVWDDLPRSKVGKVLKTDIRVTLLKSS